MYCRRLANRTGLPAIRMVTQPFIHRPFTKSQRRCMFSRAPLSSIFRQSESMLDQLSPATRSANWSWVSS